MNQYVIAAVLLIGAVALVALGSQSYTLVRGWGSESCSLSVTSSFAEISCSSDDRSSSWSSSTGAFNLDGFNNLPQKSTAVSISEELCAQYGQTWSTQNTPSNWDYHKCFFDKISSLGQYASGSVKQGSGYVPIGSGPECSYVFPVGFDCPAFNGQSANPDARSVQLYVRISNPYLKASSLSCASDWRTTAWGTCNPANPVHVRSVWDENKCAVPTGVKPVDYESCTPGASGSGSSQSQDYSGFFGFLRYIGDAINSFFKSLFG